MVTRVLSGAGGGGGKGSGGGSSSGGSTFTQTPDNLRSSDTFEGIMGVCLGPVKGATNGLKSVKLDGTPVLNTSGVENFPGFVAIVSDGNPVNFPQLIKTRLGAAAAPLSVGVGLTNTNVGAGQATPGAFVTRTLSNVNPNYIDFRFIVNQLYSQDSNGVFDATATLEIQLKPTSASAWVNPTNNGGGTGSGWQAGSTSAAGVYSYFTPSIVDQSIGAGTPNFPITGKTSSAAVYEVRVWVPNTGNYNNVSWDVRVRLLERDTYSADPIFEKRDISWESIAAVFNGTLGAEEDWRGLSWFQIYGTASDQLSGVPEVEIEMDAKIVQVPPSTVFNPTTRAYTGTIWDGSWASAWTTDPAWIINDAISDELSGLALIAPGSYLNKWDALEASKWFSTLVPDGAGGSHPRYNMNLAQTASMKAEDLIRYMAGAVGGLAWDDGEGQWRLKVDKPENPVDIFTLDNIEGEFIYSHTDVDTRFNDYSGTFLNAAMDYREDTVHVYDNTEIAILGHKPTNIALVGCTNRQEALRRLMIRLRSSTRETKVVSFTTNRRGRNVQPLDTILIADGDLGDQAKRSTGRVLSIASDRLSITVRDTMRLEVGVAYTLRFSQANPTYNPDITTQPGTTSDYRKPTIVATSTVTNTSGQRGDVTTIFLSSALPAGLPEYLAVALDAVNLPSLPRQFRVMNVNYSDDGERVAISAINIDTGKWAAADAVTNQNTVFVDQRGVAPMPLAPASGMLHLMVTPTTVGTQTSLIVNWIRPLGSNVNGFRVMYSVNGGTQKMLAANTKLTSADLVNPAYGTYKIFVYTVNRSNKLSQPLTASIVVNANTIKAAQIAYADGQLLQSLQPAAAGADPTGINIAAGIFGQGDLATLDSIDYVTQITGAKPGVGANEFTDPGFATWTLQNAIRGAKAAGTGFPIGNAPYFVELTPNTSTESHAWSPAIPVVAGRKYFFSARVQRNTTTNSGARLHLGGSWFTNTMAYIGPAGESVQQQNTTITANAIPAEVIWNQIAPSNAAFFAAAYYIPAVAGAAGKWRIEEPRVSQYAPGADITAWVTYGPDTLSFDYDSTTGLVLTGLLPTDLIYKLDTGAGSITGGITWSYKVILGGINSKTNASGATTMTGVGSGTLTVSTLEALSSQIELSAVWGGNTYKKTLVLYKNLVAGSSGGAGGGGGGAGMASKNTGFNAITNTTYVDITGTMTSVMPAGKTTMTVNANLSFRPIKTGGDGAWTVTVKVQRNISGVWTDQGSAATANSDATFYADDGPGFTQIDPADLNTTVTISGLTAGASYDTRVIAAVTAGGTRSHTPSGTVTNAAP